MLQGAVVIYILYQFFTLQSYLETAVGQSPLSLPLQPLNPSPTTTRTFSYTSRDAKLRTCPVIACLRARK